ncbi:MAG: 16S rRNA processing protein RimM [Desulfovibrio sp.]|nr:MAG: 16S rRNA processing protein RimM [Desulfovibrio sp.]
MVRIGEVVKPHGLRGEFGVDCRADTPFFFEDLDTVFIGSSAKRARAMTVESVREHKGRLLLTVRGVTDRTRAEAMRGLSVFLRDEDLPELDGDELYLHQIEGLSIVVRSDGVDTPLGTLSQILTPTPEQEVWVITTPQGKEVMFPATEEFVLEVDLDAGTAIIAPPPGLLDIYLGE